MVGLLPARRRSPLVLRPPTIDLDSTEVEVFGRAKAGMAYNYQGQRAGRPHLASWAEGRGPRAGLPLAADLLAGNQDVRPRCADLLTRAVAALPAVVCARPRVRADAGYFTAELAQAAEQMGADYAVAAKRNSAFWRELAGVPADAWTPAQGMPGAQVAVTSSATASVTLLIVSCDNSVPRVETRWCWMSRIVMPPAYKEMIMSSRPPTRRAPLGTNTDANVELRSRG